MTEAVQTDSLNYFSYHSEIEDAFTRRRGKHLMLSPLDWQLIESWKERGIPLHIVERAIEEVFDNQKSAGRKRAINSLRYCQAEVESQYGEWLKSRVGAHQSESEAAAASADRNPFSKESVESFLKSHQNVLLLARDSVEANRDPRALCDPLGDALTAAYQQLYVLWREFEEKPNAQKLEDELTKIETDLYLAIGMAATSDQVMEAREKAEAVLSLYKGAMPDEIYQQQFDNRLKKQLREMFGVPRLSLFHMR